MSFQSKVTQFNITWFYKLKRNGIEIPKLPIQKKNICAFEISDVELESI